MIRKNFYLPEKLVAIGEKIAERQGISLSEIIRIALREYLEKEVARIKGANAD